MRFMTHVEANAAAHLRRTGTPSAALYLNMRPCLGEHGCHVNLRDILPAGYRLTVYQVTASGGVRVCHSPAQETDSMSSIDEHPVHADPATLAALRELVHTLDTQPFTDHARSLGVQPPDERDGWLIVLELDLASGDERGLFWIDPDDA